MFFHLKVGRHDGLWRIDLEALSMVINGYDASDCVIGAESVMVVVHAYWPLMLFSQINTDKKGKCIGVDFNSKILMGSVRH